MAGTGWIKWWRQSELCRALEDDKFDKMHAFLWMVERANPKSAKMSYKGKTTTIKRGQFKTSIRKLSETFHWGKDKTKRFLDDLEYEGMIKTERTADGTLLTVVNYRRFQDVRDTNKDTNKDTNRDTNKPLIKKTEEENTEKTAKTSDEVRRPMTKEEIYAAELEEMGPADKW